MSHVFISYSTVDKRIADTICSFLEKGHVKCWIAPRDIMPGASYSNEIVRGIKESEVFLAVLTKNSAASPHVLNEIDIAFNQKIRIIPFFVESFKLSDEIYYYLSRKQWINGYPNYKDCLTSLLQIVLIHIKSQSNRATVVEPIVDSQKKHIESKPKLSFSHTNTTKNGHEYVDLGLSVKWAACNIGALVPSDYGHYYAWGEIEKKSVCTKENSRTYFKRLNDIGGNSSFDVASAKWGHPWRLPTHAECEELCKECIWTWTSQGQKNHTGFIVRSKKNGNAIFLPAAGWDLDTSGNYCGSRGCYWCSDPYKDISARCLYFPSNRIPPFVLSKERCFGLSVRPVFI